jgi:alpha-tubulin suppressor-like RCC1 family protein
MTPRKVELGKSNFMVDVACGNGHSLGMTNAREVMVWGSNS